MFLSLITLFVALSLSVIAAYYSIAGLTAIFAAAVIPIMVMGSILELAKVVVTLWLHEYWSRARWLMKLYLVPAVLMLMLITSMGIFGFLSKAHSDQNLVSGDVQAKIAIYDEKIKTEKENIEANRKALKQMDEGVDQVLGRSTDEKGADKAVAMRKSQQKERARLQNEISQSQKSIAELNDARAPIAAEVRKVEAEVGPIKYIAALLYGDNPDANILERAVRWVIILLVIVFDPLALMLVLAANQSKDWDDEDEPAYEPAYEPDDGPISDEVLDTLQERAKKELPTDELISKEQLFPEEMLGKSLLEEHPYLFTPVGSHTPQGIEPAPIQVYNEPSDETLEPCYKCGTPLINAPGIGPFCPNKECDVVDGWALKDSEPVEITYIPPAPIVFDLDPNFEGIKVDGKWVQTGPTFEEKPKVEEVVSNTKSYEELEGGYVTYDGKHMHKDVLLNMRPDILKLVADSARSSNTSFGSSFPALAKKGDTFVRVDSLPNKVYKFDGNRWITVNKDQSTSYIYNQEYIKYLVEKIDKGEYDIELLSDIEKQQIEEYLSKTN